MDNFNYHTHKAMPNSFVSMNMDEFSRIDFEKLHEENSFAFLELHPWFLPDEFEGLSSEFIELAKSDKVFGIGEIGLDKYSKVPWSTQISYFEVLLELAKTLDKPVMLHFVHAGEIGPKLLTKYQIKKIYLHGFWGKVEYLRQLLDYGMFVSLNPEMLKRSELFKFLNRYPQYFDSIGLETDDKDLNINELYNTFMENLGHAGI